MMEKIKKVKEHVKEMWELYLLPFIEGGMIGWLLAGGVIYTIMFFITLITGRKWDLVEEKK